MSQQGKEHAAVLSVHQLQTALANGLESCQILLVYIVPFLSPVSFLSSSGRGNLKVSRTNRKNKSSIPN